jgi:hypothetical protein
LVAIIVDPTVTREFRTDTSIASAFVGAVATPTAPTAARSPRRSGPLLEAVLLLLVFAARNEAAE